jgi:cold shock CspA family protein
MKKGRVLWVNMLNRYGLIEMDDRTEALIHFSIESSIENLLKGDRIGLQLDRRGEIARVTKL